MTANTFKIETENDYLLATILDGFRVFDKDRPAENDQDADAINRDICAALDTISEPIPVILDLRNLDLSFGELVAGMGNATRDQESLFQHPQKSEIVVITNSAVLALGANALGQDQYGNKRVAIFNDLGSAIEYATRSAN